MSLEDFARTRSFAIAETEPERFWFQSAPFPDGTRIRCALGEQDTQYIALEEIIALDPGLFEEAAVLDIGAADGLYSLMAAHGGARSLAAIDCDYTDWPLNLQALTAAWTLDIDILTGDFRRHDFGARRFDVILFMGVLYHLEDPFSAIRQFRDLLKPGGRLLIETQLSMLETDLPVFELASDLFETAAVQAEGHVDAVGVSNYVFPNRLAMAQLARTYGFSCRWLEPAVYSERFRDRGIFLFEKLEEGARWDPAEMLDRAGLPYRRRT
ncbi:MAG: methyltransferase domain-containing protein [Pseudomonadota bacterium]